MSLLLYRFFLWAYRFGAILLSPYNKKAKQWLSGRKNVFQHLQPFAAQWQGRIIWCHCASLGEFEQVRPLLESLGTQYPGYRILLSFFSPSGYETMKNYEGAALVSYLPMDGPEHARLFLERVQPSLVIWVKYEFWYFYLEQIRQNHIPLLLVSGIFRPGQLFFKPWGVLHRQMLACFTCLFVQNQASKKLLGQIGFSEHVTVTGDTRFDRVLEIAASDVSIPFITAFAGNNPVIVAGSTWEEDEEELDHFANTHPEIKFIIAPHEIDEAHLADMEKLFHRSIRYSRLKETGMPEQGATPLPNVLLIDNIGMLARLYRYATITYIGGGFGNDGVHNVLEAAVYAKPVVFGPVYEKFAEAVDLVDAGAAYSIDNALELEKTLLKLLNDREEYAAAAEKAGNYVRSNQGATGKILRYIQEKRLLTS